MLSSISELGLPNEIRYFGIRYQPPVDFIYRIPNLKKIPIPIPNEDLPNDFFGRFEYPAPTITQFSR